MSRVRLPRGRMAASLFATGVFVAACGGDGGDGARGGGADGPIKIGVLADRGSPAGESIVDAANLAADEINGAGGA
jgi:ABC-type branched-subunit amino acid transport system substrate-binding protein